MSSAILYAATAGADVGIYGDPMQLEADHAVLGGVDKPRRLWPRMHQVEVPRGYALEVSNAELGSDTVLLPEEVINVFGWAPEIKAPTPPPPPPRLEEQGSGRRGATARHRADSHRGPADAEPAGSLGRATTMGDDGHDGHHEPGESEAPEHSSQDGVSKTPASVGAQRLPNETESESPGVRDAL